MATLSNPQLQFYSSRRIADRLWTEGDSYAAATGGTGLSVELRNNGYTVINSAVGGSTMTEIRDRIIENAALIRQCKLIVWDGSQNGFVDVVSYTDLLQEGLDAVGPDFNAIPAAVPFGAVDPVQAPAIRDEFFARWPTRTLEWRDWISNTGGIINEDRMLNYPTDSVHINAIANQEAVDGLEALF